jgi:hypothetical protein
MENKNETPKNQKDDFYAAVSAIARFIETADNDKDPKKKTENDKTYA